MHVSVNINLLFVQVKLDLDASCKRKKTSLFYCYNLEKSKADSGIFMQILFLLDQIFTNLHSYLFCLPHEEHEEIFLSSVSFCYSFSSVMINSGIFHLLPVYFFFLCKILRMRYFSYHLLCKEEGGSCLRLCFRFVILPCFTVSAVYCFFSLSVFTFFPFFVSLVVVFCFKICPYFLYTYFDIL